jgi:hypothetical protein
MVHFSGQRKQHDNRFAASCPIRCVASLRREPVRCSLATNKRIEAAKTCETTEGTEPRGLQYFSILNSYDPRPILTPIPNRKGDDRIRDCLGRDPHPEPSEVRRRATCSCGSKSTGRERRGKDRNHRFDHRRWNGQLLFVALRRASAWSCASVRDAGLQSSASAALRAKPRLQTARRSVW